MTGIACYVLFMTIVVGWAAMGCYALQDYAYSRLEELCDRHGVPHRFRSILLEQDYALLALEILLTLATMALVPGIVLWLGFPEDRSAAAIARSVIGYTACTVASIVIADLVPWTIARVASEPFLYRFWPVIRLWTATLSPLLALVRAADVYAHGITGRGAPETDDAAVIGEEIRTVVDEGTREGVLEQDAGEMIERVIEFQQEDVGAVMTPRIDMVCIHVDASLEDARRELIESGHSRVPIIAESTDDILGILYAKDLLRALEPHRKPSDPIPVLRDIIREPVYVPLTTQIPALLNLMKRQHVQIAIVNDEYGGVAGLVTMEDILEEIVGEIRDEYDDEQQREAMVAVSETVAEVDGRVHLDDLNERFGYELPEDAEYDTIAGFVFSLLGRMPTAGESTDWQGLRFTIAAADRRQITRLRIEKLTTRDAATSTAS